MTEGCINILLLQDKVERYQSRQSVEVLVDQSLPFKVVGIEKSVNSTGKHSDLHDDDVAV